MITIWNNKLYTCAEVCGLLHVTRQTLAGYAIRKTRLGANVFYSEKAINDYLQGFGDKHYCTTLSDAKLGGIANESR